MKAAPAPAEEAPSKAPPRPRPVPAPTDSADERGFRRLVAVTNREPFRIVEREDGVHVERTTGGLVAAMTPAMEATNGLWISADPGRADLAARLDATDGGIGFEWAPVAYPQEQHEGYYESVSNQALWPLYHSMPGIANYDRKAWRDYEAVNRRFAERIRHDAQAGDLVWVHDYQLSLVPGMLRQGGDLPRDVRIGYFLHIPFPPYDLFRTLPWAEEILRGMVGASLVGFHVAEYTHNFFDAVERILGIYVDRLRGRFKIDGRWVHVRSLPIGTDPTRFREGAASPEVQKRARQLHRQVGCEKLVIGIDRLDYTKGIYERLCALEHFFEEYPEQRGRVSMIQLAVPSRGRIAEYKHLREQIEQQVGRINGLYARPGWTPVTYMCRSLPFDDLVALYRAGDVALVTPLRDGMNLVAKEYVATHCERDGVLILSELAGAAQQLTEAILVNPYDVERISEALVQAFAMQPAEKRRRMRTMNAKVSRFDVHQWVDGFLAEALYVD